MKERFCIVVVVLAFFCGCQNEEYFDDPYFNKSEDEIFTTGLNSFSKKDYVISIEAFEAFEGLYPLSRKVSYAQKFAIESHYLIHDFTMTKAACERFLLEHPRDVDAHYVAYRAFMADYMTAFQYPMNFLPVKRSLRECVDLKQLYVDALDFFERYPDSPYGANIAKKIPLIRKTIALHELEIGRYMLDKKQYYGFLHQFSYVTKNFPHTQESKRMYLLREEFMRIFKKKNLIKK